METIPRIDDLLKESNEEIDELFAKAFESFEQARRHVDRLHTGAVVNSPAPVAGNNARTLVTQGEGRHEVRVPRGQIHQAFPHIPIPPRDTTRVWVRVSFCVF